MGKRVLALLMVLCMCVSFFPVSVLAEEGEGDCQHIFVDGGCTECGAPESTPAEGETDVSEPAEGEANVNEPVEGETNVVEPAEVEIGEKEPAEGETNVGEPGEAEVNAVFFAAGDPNVSDASIMIDPNKAPEVFEDENGLAVSLHFLVTVPEEMAAEGYQVEVSVKASQDELYSYVDYPSYAPVSHLAQTNGEECITISSETFAPGESYYYVGYLIPAGEGAEKIFSDVAIVTIPDDGDPQESVTGLEKLLAEIESGATDINISGKVEIPAGETVEIPDDVFLYLQRGAELTVAGTLTLGSASLLIDGDFTLEDGAVLNVPAMINLVGGSFDVAAGTVNVSGDGFITVEYEHYADVDDLLSNIPAESRAYITSIVYFSWNDESKTPEEVFADFAILTDYFVNCEYCVLQLLSDWEITDDLVIPENICINVGDDYTNVTVSAAGDVTIINNGSIWVHEGSEWAAPLSEDGTGRIEYAEAEEPAGSLYVTSLDELLAAFETGAVNVYIDGDIEIPAGVTVEIPDSVYVSVTDSAELTVAGTLTMGSNSLLIDGGLTLVDGGILNVNSMINLTGGSFDVAAGTVTVSGNGFITCEYEHYADTDDLLGKVPEESRDYVTSIDYFTWNDDAKAPEAVFADFAVLHDAFECCGSCILQLYSDWEITENLIIPEYISINVGNPAFDIYVTVTAADGVTVTNNGSINVFEGSE